MKNLNLTSVNSESYLISLKKSYFSASIYRGALDGIKIAALLSLPHLKYVQYFSEYISPLVQDFQPIFPILPFKIIASFSAIEFVSGSIGCYAEEMAIESDYGSSSYMVGGAIKYYLQTIMSPLIYSEELGLIKNNALVVFKPLAYDTFTIKNEFTKMAIEGIGSNIKSLIALGDDQPPIISVLSSVPGRIVSINVQSGDVIEANQKLLIIEIMKMEVTVSAPQGGVVKQINFQVGAMVEVGEELIGMVDYNIAIDAVN